MKLCSVNRGGASRDRTGDLLHAMQALSQLSYGPVQRSAIIGGVHADLKRFLPKIVLTRASRVHAAIAPRRTPCSRLAVFGKTAIH